MVTVTFKKLLDEFVGQSELGFGSSLTLGEILLNLLITLALALFVYYVYRKTFSGVMYAKNFNVTLIMTAMITTMLIMSISGNLALSLGMVGALSIVRFRTAIKDPKDVAFLFWAISVGIVNGVAYYKLSIPGSLVIGAVLYVFNKKFKRVKAPYLLVLKYDSLNEEALAKTLAENASSFRLRNTTIRDEGSERTLEVRLVEGREQEILAALKKLRGIKQVMLFSHEGELAE